ncbi:MAG: hypothetical protein WBL80_01595 [Erysipelotrichaceae bacterium]
MKHTLIMKTSKCILPILIGIFVVSGILISLPLLKSNAANAEAGYELQDGNAIITAVPLAKTTFVLPLIPLSFQTSRFTNHQQFIKPQKDTVLFSKDIFRNVLFARAP